MPARRGKPWPEGGARLRESLARAGLSRRQAAQMAKMSPCTVMNLAKGMYAPSNATVAALGAVLNVDPGWLLTGATGGGQPAQSGGDGPALKPTLRKVAGLLQDIAEELFRYAETPD